MAISPRTIALLQTALMRGAETAAPEVAAEASQVARPAFGSLAPGVQQAAEAAPAAQGIRAYHGSPHDFDAFDLSKIGTGEGAQAYGHGLYFAEAEPVAKQYRDVLTRRPVNDSEITPTVTGNALFDIASKNGELIDGKIPFGPNRSLMTRDQIVGGFEQGKFTPFDLTPGMQRQIVDHIKPPGKMYETRINADPEHFLDWDKPPHEQHQIVQDALKKLDLFHPEKIAEAASDPTVTQQLKDLGVPGIRYLDQGSRNAGGWHITPPTQTTSGKWMVKSSDYNSKGMHFDTEAEAKAALAEKVGGQTRNYVVFNDKLIEIMRKYGLAGLIGGGGLAKLGGGDGSQS